MRLGLGRGTFDDHARGVPGPWSDERLLVSCCLGDRWRWDLRTHHASQRWERLRRASRGAWGGVPPYLPRLSKSRGAGEAWMPAMTSVRLRPVAASDLETFFAHQRDPVARRLG